MNPGSSTSFMAHVECALRHKVHVAYLANVWTFLECEIGLLLHPQLMCNLQHDDFDITSFGCYHEAFTVKWDKIY